MLMPDCVFKDELTQRNHVHCRYLIALGSLGLGEIGKAVRSLDEVLARAPNHLVATLFRQVDAAPFAAKVGVYGERGTNGEI